MDQEGTAHRTLANCATTARTAQLYSFGVGATHVRHVSQLINSLQLRSPTRRRPLKVRFRSIANAVSLVFFSIVTVSAWSAPPRAVFKAVDVPGTTPFSATVLNLSGARYVEEAFYVNGVANRYRITNPLDTAQVIDGDHRYVSRVIVRRPLRRQDFNGTVIVEWYNVTGGQDADIVFAATHDYLLREGFAFIAVSAQRVGVDTLRKWSPARYGALGVEASNVDPANDKPIDASGDVLSWDIYGQVGAALREGAGLGGLKAERLIAVGESQSAGRLTSYYNAIQPLHRVYDGFLTYDRAGALRTDIGVKSISVGTDFRVCAALHRPMQPIIVGGRLQALRTSVPPTSSTWTLSTYAMASCAMRPEIRNR